MVGIMSQIFKKIAFWLAQVTYMGIGSLRLVWHSKWCMRQLHLMMRGNKNYQNHASIMTYKL
jgi:hypothetical protein